MHWGLAGALLAAVVYGVATVLQAVGARRIQRATALNVRLLWRLAHSLPYIGGLLLDAVGFLLSLAALRTLPLFVVQAVVASSLAVTALLAALVLHARLRAREWVAIGVVSVGLAMLGLAAGPEHPARVDVRWRLGLFCAVGLITVVGMLAVRGGSRAGGTSSAALGALAGLAYGAAGVAARVLAHPRSLAGLLDDPATGALVLAGLVGLMLYATALQRGSVTVATAAVVVTETVVPALVGVVTLGDRPRHGTTGLAAAGFVLTVAAALNLARHGEAQGVEPGPPSQTPAPEPPASRAAQH